jgi:4-hydroxy-4-methyl-2-oxoglutarate aldolase
MTSSNMTAVELLRELRSLDTACLCDADKSFLATGDLPYYQGIQLLSDSLKPRHVSDMPTMAGIARTIKCTKRNDFLAVLRGLLEANENDVLMVHTADSSLAVAGELFATQAKQKGMQGIVVDGPMRDTAQLVRVHCYSTRVTPYSGSIQSVGEMQTPILCGGVLVRPGDIVVGDNDGILIAPASTFETLLPTAKTIFETEAKVRARLHKGESLDTLTNYTAHVEARLAGKPSSLEFKVDD